MNQFQQLGCRRNYPCTKAMRFRTKPHKICEAQMAVVCPYVLAVRQAVHASMFIPQSIPQSILWKLRGCNDRPSDCPTLLHCPEYPHAWYAFVSRDLGLGPLLSKVYGVVPTENHISQRPLSVKIWSQAWAANRCFQEQ